MVDLKIIKRSIAYRAKYRKHEKKLLGTWSVVPHPSNRGGEVVKSSRTKQINGIILKAGYDPVEAQFNAVVIEQTSKGGRDTTFQALFAASVAADPDMAISSNVHAASYGSVSHSHANCSKRNILACKHGCMCSERQLAVAGKCTCEVSSILDANGNYDIESVKLADIEWYNGLWGGDYEVLHSAIDDEEP